MSGRRVLCLGAAVGIAIAAACVDVSTEPTAIGSIGFDTLPYPAIVAGESLRDSSGAEAPFRARVYNTQGELIPDAAVEYFTADTLATISDQGVLSVRALRASPGVRVFAVAGTLQAAARDEVQIVPRPDTLRRPNPTGADSAAFTIDTLRFPIDTSARGVSDQLVVRLQHREPDATVSPVRSWLVSFRVQHDGVDLPAGDTMAVAFLADSVTGRPAHLDTTNTSGDASRILRVRRAALATPVDSLIVFATAKYRGQPVPGSPVRLVLYVKP